MDSAKQLKTCREKIDRLNTELLAIIIERNLLIKNITELKLKDNLPLFDPQRTEDMLSDISKIINKKYKHLSSEEKNYIYVFFQKYFESQLQFMAQLKDKTLN